MDKQQYNEDNRFENPLKPAKEEPNLDKATDTKADNPSAYEEHPIQKKTREEKQEGKH
jgi:hypothetical protein